MLSQSALPLISATLPVVSNKLPEIAERFYRHMFAARPDLLDGLFNRGNQARGNQQQALAGSIAAFAASLVKADGSLPAATLSRISHKHASLGLRPDQYEVVNEHLMWAIGDVLGEAVTHEAAAAWNEVYWLMAEILISQERDLYRRNNLGEGDVWSDWKIVRKTAESADVVTMVFVPVQPDYQQPSTPGQYVSIRLTMPDGLLQPRQYSLSRADDGSFRQITVRRERPVIGPQGEVSAALHDHYEEGDVLAVSPPFGEVVLTDSPRPLVLVSAGVGVTPHAAMISHLANTQSDRPVTFLHVDRGTMPFILEGQLSDDLSALAGARSVVWDSRDGALDGLDIERRSGRMDLGSVDLPGDAEYFLCGSLPFMQDVRAALMANGITSEDIRYEVFGPDLWLVDAND